LSRVGRGSEELHRIPMGDVIQGVLHDFEFSLRERHATVAVREPLPEVLYDPTQLGMVFRNLIANAIKFNNKQEPKVDIEVKELDRDYEVVVADNGIGIEKQHFEKIFIIFQRLHRSEDYRGTGAGLTIVKKIVEKHGGRIWVESKVEEGTAFHFTIPRQGTS
jgi:light-regulated signal transduction histidine kinase (bacteriophytochrome)